MKYLILILISSFAVNGWSDSKSVNEKINQLEENSVNSAENAQKFKANLQRSKSNLNKVQASISDLKEAQRKILKSRKALNGEGGELVEVTSKLSQFKTEEEKKLKKDQETLARLQRLQQELQANIEKRQANIQVYQSRLNELSSSNKKWSAQKEQLDELDRDIASKIELAKKEEGKWTSKVAIYSSEAKTWEKKSQEARQKQMEFKELAN